jgi:hypothetical protein
MLSRVRTYLSQMFVPYLYTGFRITKQSTSGREHCKPSGKREKDRNRLQFFLKSEQVY